MGAEPFGIDLPTMDRITAEVVEVARDGTELCIVVRGGNIFRGLSAAARGLDRVIADVWWDTIGL